MIFAWGLSALALVFGVALGARALYDPAWAAKLVRLKADEQGGGQAEFRATFGGVFLGLHLVALVFTLLYLTSGAYLAGVCATGASAAIAAGWAGAAFGRAIAIWRDGQAQLIPNSLGEVLTPSAVSLDKRGTVYVGRAARDLERTLRALERHLARV